MTTGCKTKWWYIHICLPSPACQPLHSRKEGLACQTIHQAGVPVAVQCCSPVSSSPAPPLLTLTACTAKGATVLSCVTVYICPPKAVVSSVAAYQIHLSCCSPLSSLAAPLIYGCLHHGQHRGSQHYCVSQHFVTSQFSTIEETTLARNQFMGFQIFSLIQDLHQWKLSQFPLMKVLHFHQR